MNNEYRYYWTNGLKSISLLTFADQRNDKQLLQRDKKWNDLRTPQGSLCFLQKRSKYPLITWVSIKYLGYVSGRKQETNKQPKNAVYRCIFLSVFLS